MNGEMRIAVVAATSVAYLRKWRPLKVGAEGLPQISMSGTHIEKAIKHLNVSNILTHKHTQALPIKSFKAK